MSLNSVCIVGAGNGGFAAAADFAQSGVEVRLYGRNPSTIRPLLERGGVEYEGIFGDGFVRLTKITSDIADAMRGADVVVMMVPTQAHEETIDLIAKHLSERQVLLAAPGHTLMLLPNSLRSAGRGGVPFCETATLPYICRKTAPDRIKVSRKAAMLKFSSFPATHTKWLSKLLEPLLPGLSPVPTLLDTVFPYTNAVHHPPALLCNIGRVESTGGDYMHYYEGITPAVGRVIDALDRERLKIAAAFGCEVDQLSEYFYKVGYTTEDGRVGGGAYSVFHNSEPNRWIRAPTSVDHRFFNEDIPYGLVPLTELAKVSGVPTPASDSVIELASIAAGKDYRSVGLTCARMGIEGYNPTSLRKVLEHGYSA